MFTSAELIQALWRRARRSIRPPRPPGEFPPGWQAWFDSLGTKVGAVTGATADAIVAIALQREPPPLPNEAQLSGWQAFGALWRQQWQPASTDERWMRVSSSSLSLILHIVFAVLLMWLMHARYLQPFAPAQRGEDTVVEVEFIGEGTPEEEGGGAPQQSAQAAEETERDEAAAPAPPVRTAPQPVLPPPSMAAREPVEQETPAPPAEQPLEVTETEQPDLRFVVPPPLAPELARPQLAMPEVPLRSREIEPIEVPELTVPQPRPLPQAEIEVPDLQQPEVEVVEREIAAPLPRVDAPQLAAPSVAAPELQRDAPQVPTREIPLRRPARGQAQGDAARAATGEAERGAATAAAPSSAPDAAGGTRPDATASGSAPAQSAAPGALQTPRRGDDWGASTRDQAGGQRGTSDLFNPDGSPRLPPGTATAGGGLPPGTIIEDFEKIDRMGTWLKRPPIGYEPTSFDRFWVPHETLLEEWVRRSIRTVLIPIPGTSKSIRCDVVTLALAGGCSITDPNLQDVEAEARPPPDVPFKRDLFEDPDSLGD